MPKKKSPYETPMMVQFMEMKEQYPECILFFRMGDFYEMFLEDAIMASEVLGITLTDRSRGKDGKIPMAGVPYHAVDTYLSKMVSSGYKVAICEQLTNPNELGPDGKPQKILERGVVRIVTPGTVLDDNSLNRSENNYVVSIGLNKKASIIGMSFADISTGTIYSFQRNEKDFKKVISNEFSKFKPRECILTHDLYNDIELLKGIKEAESSINIYPFGDEISNASAEKQIKEQFNIKSLASFGLDEEYEAIKATSKILEYLRYTQKDKIKHIKKISSYVQDEYLYLDKSTIINLELLTTLRDHERKGSFINHIDKTKTAMGARLLKQWMLKPLIDIKEINKRYDVVQYYIEKRTQREKIREKLKSITDIERLLSKISVGLGNPRDLLNLGRSVGHCFEVKEMLVDEYAILDTVKKELDSKLKNVVKDIESTLVDDPPVDPKSGGLIQENINLKLDEIKNNIKDSKDWIAKLEDKEKKRTGISNLRVRFNKVFGFYIEVSKSNLDKVPENYERKQTLVNAERFITPELKEHEEIILTAEEEINALEYELFEKLVENTLEYTQEIQSAATAIAKVDCLLSFSELSDLENYNKPELNTKGELIIKNGRHPVVETLLEDTQFVPNDVELTNKDNQLLIITGPNMAGKSVFIRQVALITLMAQMGCFIPVEEANISIVDKIFVRSGASDVITSGLSTFMVEMVETANILNNATNDSLIVMDEIGRGTSTYDGISIAWSVAQYLVENSKKIRPKTLFATHYHELEALEQKYPKKVSNYQMAIAESNQEPIFLHKLIKGGAGHSYGISVAKLAGVPNDVIENANKKLKELEGNED